MKNADFQLNPLQIYITFGYKYFIRSFKISNIFILMSVSDKILDYLNRNVYSATLLFSILFFDVLAIALPIRFRHLKENGVLAVFRYLSLHSSEYYSHKEDGRKLPNCDMLADCLVRLPLFYELKEEVLGDIIKSIKDFYNTNTV